MGEEQLIEAKETLTKLGFQYVSGDDPWFMIFALEFSEKMPMPYLTYFEFFITTRGRLPQNRSTTVQLSQKSETDIPDSTYFYNLEVSSLEEMLSLLVRCINFKRAFPTLCEEIFQAYPALRGKAKISV